MAAGLTITTVFLLLLLNGLSNGLDNGLARTPPMGWMSWQRFRCNTDCKSDPDHCISEKLFMDMADMIVEKGFQKAGYEYVIIDDCWLDHKRDGSGKLQPDYGRFPSGIKALADYVHGKGLKFGIYEDYGNFTCGGYPGILGHLETDANTFAEWGVDYIKVDGCYADPSTMDQGYPEFGKYLNATGRPIVYSCSWPDYQLAEGKKPNYNLISQHCNLWRNFDDIDDSWVSVLSIIDYYGSSNTSNDFAPVAGPGHWNDPDMLIIGNFGLSLDQSRVQMAIWAVLAAPLIMSNDLRTIRPEFTAILTNAHVIRINQDPMGIQGRRVYSQKNVDIFTKPVLPSSNGVFSEAVAVMYRGSYGTPINVSFLPQALGTNAANAYNFEVVDVFDNTVIGTYRPDEPITVSVNPTGVRLLKLNVNPRGTYATNEIPVPHNPSTDADEIIVDNNGLSGWWSDEL